MGTGIEETMMGAEGTGRPIRRANALRGDPVAEDLVTPRT